MDGEVTVPLGGEAQQLPPQPLAIQEERKDLNDTNPPQLTLPPEVPQIQETVHQELVKEVSKELPNQILAQELPKDITQGPGPQEPPKENDIPQEPPKENIHQEQPKENIPQEPPKENDILQEQPKENILQELPKENIPQEPPKENDIPQHLPTSPIPHEPLPLQTQAEEVPPHTPTETAPPQTTHLKEESEREKEKEPETEPEPTAISPTPSPSPVPQSNDVQTTEPEKPLPDPGEEKAHVELAQPGTSDGQTEGAAPKPAEAGTPSASHESPAPSAAPETHHLTHRDKSKKEVFSSESEDENGSKPPKEFPQSAKAFKKFYLAHYVNQAAARLSNLNKKRKKLSEEIKEKGLRTTVEEKIVSSQEKLNAKLMAVPILRTKDKVSFVLGIILLMLSEFVVISLPQWMWLYYVMMLIPLMVNRFVSYHRSNAHYFMLDFCYYMQVWALIVIFVYPNDISLFKVFFGLCNGPLLMAVIIWENKMVFHDLDKITSLFIHVFPPLLSYTMRWYTNVENTTDVPITFYDMFCMVLFYVFWQFLYVLKTEWLDAEKFAKDTSLMSSARWLSSVQPHPIYKKMMKLTSNKATATQILVGVQLFYTIIAILPVNLMFNYHSFHLLSILVAIGFSSWYGASFYFESFTMNYTKRLEQKINKFYKNNKESIEGTRKPKKALPSSLQSFISFLKYFSLSLITLIGLMNLLILS